MLNINLFLYLTLNIYSFISQFQLTYMTFYIARFIGLIEIYHTVPFMIDIIGFVITISLTLIQVYQSHMLKRKYVERIKM